MLRCQLLGREASGVGDPLPVEPKASALSDAEVVPVALAVGGQLDADEVFRLRRRPNVHDAAVVDGGRS
jgi:hypothetical protein